MFEFENNIMKSNLIIIILEIIIQFLYNIYVEQQKIDKENY